jgi:hypothetical protein
LTGPATDLAVDVQRRLEAVYALDSEAPVTEFLIPASRADAYPGGGSRTLVTEEEDGIALGVILEESVSERLAQADPRIHLDQDNLAPFCVLTEEVSHFVYLLFCARAARTVTELELELQGEVDKYLSASILLASQNGGAVSRNLRDLLFRHYRLVDDLPADRAARYETASALAHTYCGHLEERYLKAGRFTDLARDVRRFYRLGQREKLERIASCPRRG